MKKLKRIENEKFFFLLRHRKCYANIDRKTVLMFCLLGKKISGVEMVGRPFPYLYIFQAAQFFSLINTFIIISSLLSMPLFRQSFRFFSSSLFHVFHFSLYSLMCIHQSRAITNYKASACFLGN